MKEHQMTAFPKRIIGTLCSLLKPPVKFVVYKGVLPLLYRWYARMPMDKNLVIFADMQDREMPDNFLGLYDLCQRNGFRCVVLSGRSFSDRLPRWIRWRAKLYFQLQFITLFARCRALFLAEYFSLAYLVTPRSGTEVVQLWHGCGAMKRMGYAVTSKKWGPSERELARYPMHKNYTLVTTSSPAVNRNYVEAFRCSPDAVKALGCPRTDRYFDGQFRKQALEKVRSMLPNTGGKKMALYAPTFRGSDFSTSYINCELDFSVLKEALSDQYVLLTKFHPLTAHIDLSRDSRTDDFIFDVSNTLTPEEALCAADVLITDYSSIAFEYLLLERPIISYIPDIDEYVRDRGLFYPYDQLLPGPYVSTQEELIKTLQTVDDWFDLDKTRRYREKFMSACDGHSTERIYQYVFYPETRKEEKKDA